MLMESGIGCWLIYFCQKSQHDHSGTAPRLPNLRSVVNKQHNGLGNGTQRQTEDTVLRGHQQPLNGFPCCTGRSAARPPEALRKLTSV